MESDIPHLFVFSAVPDDKHYLVRPEATGLPENSEGGAFVSSPFALLPAERCFPQHG